MTEDSFISFSERNLLLTQRFKEVFEGHGFEQIVWVQEEPRNYGFCGFVEKYLRDISGREVQIIARPGLAGTSVGSSTFFKAQSAKVLEEVKQIIK